MSNPIERTAPNDPPMSNPIERVSPNDPRLPSNLFLAGPDDAEILPDGRAVPLSLPPATRALHFPDLAPVTDAPEITSGAIDTTVLATDTPLTVTITGTNASGEPVAETVPILPLPDMVEEPNPSNTVAGNLTPSTASTPEPEPPPPAAPEDVAPAAAEEP